MNLRDYQQHDVAAIRRAFRTHQAVLYTAPTGSGKTVLFGYIAASADRKGTRTLILVHRRELLHQTSATLRAFDVEHGLIAVGEPATDARVQVASVQTVARRGLTFRPDFLVIDEAHHAVSPAWRKVIDAAGNVKILGVTATPERLDGRGLQSIFTKLVTGPSVRTLMDQGHLAKYRMFADWLEIFDDTEIPTRAGDFSRSHLADTMQAPHITGCAIDHWKRIAQDRPTVVFCVDIEHMNAVHNGFCDAGIPSARIDGKLSRTERNRRILWLAKSYARVLISCDLISEGFDCPTVDAVVLLRPTQSLALYLQQVGRGLRPSPSGRPCIILDHAGNSLRHGMPDTPRAWSLDGREARERDSPPGAVWHCPHCFCVNAVTRFKCVECGHERVSKPRHVEQRDGELVELTPAEIDRRESERLSGNKREERDARSLEDFQRIERNRGYRPGWARIRWIVRQRKRRTTRQEIAT